MSGAPVALTPFQLGEHITCRAHIQLAVLAARRAGWGQVVVASLMAIAFEEQEALERGAAKAADSVPPPGGGRRGPQRGGRP